MKVLLLRQKEESQKKFCETLKNAGDEVVHLNEDIFSNNYKIENFDFIICFGYRRLIPNKMVEKFNNKIINLHISLLPWNRGADPNLWSFLESTPKGVSIHFIDSGIDTGPILTSKKVEFSNNETLRSSYNILLKTIESLFDETWKEIRLNKLKPIKQLGKGSFHKFKDKEQYKHLLIDGWDTKINLIKGKANETQ